MASKRLVLLSGRAGSGKNLVADLLRENLVHVRHIAFSEPLKEFAGYVFGFNKETLWGPSSARNAVHERLADPLEWMKCDERFSIYGPKWLASILRRTVDDIDEPWTVLRMWWSELGGEAAKNGGVSARYVLQTLGTECGRSIDRDIWARCGLARAQTHMRDDVRAVVMTDCRFINEGVLGRELGGELWFMNRTADVALEGKLAQHPSEVEMTSEVFQRLVTRQIHNTGTIEDLKTVIEGLVREVF